MNCAQNNYTYGTDYCHTYSSELSITICSVRDWTVLIGVFRTSFFFQTNSYKCSEFCKNIRLFTVLHEQYLDLSWVHVSAIKMSLWVLHFWASELSFCYPSNASLKLVENNVHGIKLLKHIHLCIFCLLYSITPGSGTVCVVAAET